MAPSQQVAETQLRSTTKELFYGAEREVLTVNLARARAAGVLGLDEDFFTNGDWKSRSKKVVKEVIDRLLEKEENGEGPSDEELPRNDESVSQNVIGTKRPSPDEESPAPKKKQKKTPASRKNAGQAEPDLSEVDEKPAKKRRRATKKKVVESDDDNADSDVAGEEAKSKKAKVVRRKKKTISDDEISLDGRGVEDAGKAERMDEEKELKDVNLNAQSDKEAAGDNPEVKAKTEEPVAPVDDENEYSDVVDEPVKPRRKSKGSSKESKESKGKKGRPATKKEPAEVSADVLEMRKLQGQLVKCGVRKVWGNELKKYGDNSKAKIKHLRGMLKEIGMDGRFSEAKAREIKERRELMADLEAVQEGAKSWGVGGRASRSRAKQSYKQSASNDQDENGKDDNDVAEDDGDDDDDDDDDDDNEARARSKRDERARAKLAALIDSDSDE